MSLPRFAEIPAIEARLRRDLTEDEATQAEAALDDASDLIRAEAGLTFLDEDGALSGTVAQLGALKGVAANAAARVMRNPAGAGQQTAGPFSQSFPTPSPSVYLTKSERLIVAQAAGRSGLRTVSTTRGPVETPTPRSRFTIGADAEHLGDIA